jgi:hypothetical protein
MQAFAALSMLISLVVTVVMGVKLLLVARRTRALPELCFGIAFLSGGLGQAFGQIGHRLIWNTPGPLATTLNTLLFAFVVIATLALYVAVWRVFRPADRLGVWSFAIGSGLAIGGYAMRINSGDFALMGIDSTGNLVFTISRVAIFAWAAAEALHHSSMLFKRAKLGLADLQSAHQIRLWGIAGLFTLAMTLIIGHNTVFLHRSPLEDPISTALLMVCVLPSTLAMYFAFFPPAWLRERMQGQTAPA